MKAALRVLVFLLLAGTAIQLQAARAELILFLFNETHPVSQDIARIYLPKIRQMAESQGIDLKVLDAANGAPEMVTFAPAIVFQNHLGRSLYIGRYHHVDKIKTFIRTVKRLPQVHAENEKHEVFIQKTGRATLVNPVKVTDLGGVLPKKFDPEAFHAQALAALAKGMSRFSFQALYNARRNDRLIYTAFYPYRSEDGKFFLSAEMYSQFNCISPVYKRFDSPFSGTWKDWRGVFTRAGQEIEHQVDTLIHSVLNGDGFIPLPESNPLKSFEELGLPLPAPDPGQSATSMPQDRTLAQAWKVSGPVEPDIPVVGFAFPAPLDNYAGELTLLAGSLILGQNLDMTTATGSFSVEMQSLTMGDPDLDQAVAGMLKVVQNPKSAFVFRRMEHVEYPRMAFGTLTQLSVEGEFDFMGMKAPVVVGAQVEPVLDEAGQPRLQVFAAFQIRLKEPYGVKGPDGPDPAKDTVVFTLNFLLEPAA